MLRLPFLLLVLSWLSARFPPRQAAVVVLDPARSLRKTAAEIEKLIPQVNHSVVALRLQAEADRMADAARRLDDMNVVAAGWLPK